MRPPNYLKSEIRKEVFAQRQWILILRCDLSPGRYFLLPILPVPYSYRKATIGSTRMAQRAGT